VGEHSATAKVQGKDSGLSIDNNEIIEPETIIIAPTVRVCVRVCECVWFRKWRLAAWCDLYAQYAKTTGRRMWPHQAETGAGKDMRKGCVGGGKGAAFNYGQLLDNRSRHNGRNNNVCTITKDARDARLPERCGI